MILRDGQLPAAPTGERIMVIADPPPEESQVIVKPDDQKLRPHIGVIMHAGLGALDKMHDHGHEIGDRIWWGKFAGVFEEWDRITVETKKGAACDHLWTRQAAPMPHVKVWKCDHCESTRQCDAIGIMNVDDVLANESLERRIEGGSVGYKRGVLSNGKTQHVLERKDQ